MTKGVADWLTKNIWAILALIGGVAQGYNVGTSTMAAMKADIENLKQRVKHDDDFHVCLIRTIDQLRNGKESPCELKQPN